MKYEVIQLYINGMTCTGCKKRIEKSLNSLAGIKSAKVSYQTGIAEITYDSSNVSQKEIKFAIERLGYKVLKHKQPTSVYKTICLLAIIVALFIFLDYFGILNLLVPSQLADSSMGFGMLFAIGLITSVHCIAMCGGINLSQCLPHEENSEENRSRIKNLFPALLYNLGRVISYTVIGLVLGFVGMLFGGNTETGISTLLQGILKIVAGIFMVIMGINMLGLFPSLRKLTIHIPKALSGKIGKAKTKSRRPLIVGLLNGLMPCGPLQSMQIIALASGNPLIGALSMLMFSLGTVPLMLSFGSLVSVLGKKFTRIVTTIGAVLVVVLGLAMLSQGGNLSGLFSFRNLLAFVVALSVIGIVSILPYKTTIQKTVCVVLCVCICISAFTFFSVRYPRASENAANSSVEIIEGVQVVRSTLEPGDYPDITVHVNLPVKWIIDAPEGSVNGCNNRVIIHEYAIEYSFKTGENIIEFTPTETGTFSYSCWMGMIYGSIVVTE